MKRFTPTNLVCLVALAVLFVSGLSMLPSLFGGEAAAGPTKTEIDWRALYPFPEEEAGETEAVSQPPADQQEDGAPLDQLKDKISDTKEDVLGYHSYLDLVGLFRRATNQTRTGDTVLLNNGFLTSMVARTDEATAQYFANSVIRFAQRTQAAGTPLLYVQVPQKVSPTDDQMPPGEATHINENLDDHLARLQAGGVDTFDLRQSIQDQGLDHYSLFFRTDHHWTMESGLWAARQVAGQLNARYGLVLDTQALDPENFTQTTYANWYLGAQGRQVTRGYISPDDFSLLLPKAATSFRVEHPDREVVLEGDFSKTMFDQATLTTKSYYELSTYEAVLYGNRPLTRIQNKNNPDGPKILLIHDSYSTVVAPYLAMLSSQLDLIDVREQNGNFTGSLDAYREEMQPDLVLVMYCSPVNIDRSGG